MIPLAIAILITATITVSILARIDNWQRDWSTNHARLDATAEDPELQPLRLRLPPEEVAQIIGSWADTAPRWERRIEQSEGEWIELHLTHTTKWMRFVDDIRVQLVPEAGGTRVEAESQSRIGKGDLGQNPRNLKELVGAINHRTTQSR